MFQWDKSIDAISVSADKVVHLFRSMREVQMALPGVPAQEASAYLCQYRVTDGIATVAVFHLYKSQLLAFYCSDPRVVSEQMADSMLDQSLNFVESMGFLMTDQDIHLLDESDQEMLWSSLPLKAGLTDQKEPDAACVKSLESVTAVEAGKGETSQPEQDTATEATGRAAPDVVTAQTATVPAEKPSDRAGDESEADDNVEDLLAAVEALRAKRPGLRARKTAPSADEMNRRRSHLRETIGRILASL